MLFLIIKKVTKLDMLIVEICNKGRYSYKIHKPKQDFSSFDGEDIHKGLYKYNQFFKIEEIHENENLKQERVEVTLKKYVEPISCGLGCGGGSFKRTYESYLKDFDIEKHI